MAAALNLGEFEQLILLAILRLREDAYGVSIRAELADRTGRNVAPGALYTALDRLETKGLITSRMSDPTPQRGGRAKRHVTVTAAGIEALTRAVRAFERLLDGLNLARGRMRDNAVEGLLSLFTSADRAEAMPAIWRRNGNSTDGSGSGCTSREPRWRCGAAL